MSNSSDVFQADYCAQRLKSLGDPHRLRIVDALQHGELTVSDIAELLETELVTISHHLKIMKHADLVTVRREGRYMYYRLHDDLLHSRKQGKRLLDLGCCRLEVPDAPETNA
ncbi:MAG: winged helix-turn-helix transcriptional regulator [Planctomycetaceae bacterium]|nr:winged helix-turn-helix transcriptional regulator [Planctomycetaceae bacterium]MCB9949976.1 winged helix-turn-helix transcriptional regulator [Planctomycetaceae bacterium]